MKKIIQKIMDNTGFILEAILSVIVIVAIIGSSIGLVREVFGVNAFFDSDYFNVFLGKVMALAIGVEFIKMLCKHTPGTIIEVLLFSIARQLIVNHSSAIDTIVGVVALAILFAIRKFLLIPFDETEKTVFRGSTKVRVANRLAGIKIPPEDGSVLSEVMEKQLKKYNKHVAEGAIVYYNDFALRVAHIHEDGKISRVEIIKSI